MRALFQRAVSGWGAGDQGQEKKGAPTHSSMTVIARHSTMAGCEGGRRGISEDAEG